MRNDTFNSAASTLVGWKRFIVGALCLRVAAGRRVAFQTALLALEFQIAMMAQPALVADTVLINAKVVTVDRLFSIAESIAIREGRLLAVGSNTQIEALTGPNTVRIDLSGRTDLPGLMVTQMHVRRAGTPGVTVSLAKVT